MMFFDASCMMLADHGERCIGPHLASHKGAGQSFKSTARLFT